MSGSINLRWKPPGPVAAAFMNCDKRVQIINGPIGSGKTTTALVKAMRIATRQRISTASKITLADGDHPVRKVKVAAVRDTYRQLWKTTLPSWFKRVPREVGEFTGAENGPARHTVPIVLQDNSVVEFIIEFGAIGENAVEDFMRGYEPTFWYLNEADLLAREVYNFARGRWGRYPDVSEGGPSWWGILMDCNAPEFTNWMYKDIFLREPEDVGLFRQPSGFSPQAENIENLIANYYTEQALNQPDWYIRRMIENEPGFSRAGKVVYPEFRDQLHVPGYDIEPVEGLPLGIGLDAGMSPAALIGQRMPSGQRRALDELVAEQGTGPIRFAEMLSKLLHDRYPNFKNIRGYADPSAAYGADKHAGEKSWIEIVSARAGIRIDAAPTNALIPRLEAVRSPLSKLIDGQPAYLCSRRCVVLREGFNAGYRMRKIEAPGDTRYTDEPEKNSYSHIHDANQYWCSADGEDLEIRERKWTDEKKLRSFMQQSQSDWDPFSQQR